MNKNDIPDKWKLGSLFDGSGGFPLAGLMCGIEPVWASEVEPYPIAVTKSRFPNMIHLGDVSKINGGTVEPVHIITFGSPCQDMSVAGKRAGIKHEENGDDETTRSGLFMEAIRIIKEMREATNGEYPKYAIWENVPGAFSSNKGEDFRLVLEEFIKTVEPAATMPSVPKNGWAYADCYTGDGWSLAYRVLDAQYWGVPQRRRRIYLVFDFTGECAREILFEREGLRGYFETGRTPWQGTAGNAEDCPAADDREGNRCITFEPGILRREGGHVYEGVAGTLRANAGDNQLAVAFAQNQRDEVRLLGDKAGSLQAQPGMKQQTFIVDSHILDDQGGQQISIRTDGKSPTLRAESHGNVPCVMEAAGFKPSQGSKAMGIGWEEEVSPTLLAGQEPGVCIKCYDIGEARLRTPSEYTEVAPTLTARCGTGGNNVPAVVYDARGNGDGVIVSTITGDHENRITDYTAVCVERKVYESHPMDSRIKELDDGISSTVSAKWHKGAADTPLVCEERSVYCLQGNGIDRADTAGCNGKGWKEDVCYTLNTIDHPAVAFQTYQKVTGPLMANSHPGSYTGQDAFSDMLVAGVDCRNMNEYPNLYPTLQAKPNGGQSLNFSGAVRVRYIVRRLTPTECARLQGFPDTWGHPNYKEDLMDDEYRFWLDVRNANAVINGKQTKEYTKAQILTWYNKLHTDSSEYKMWGNGIALPNALYVMQGIALEMERNTRP